MKKNAPIVMIGLDAAEYRLIEKWTLEGKLPVLQALRAQGCFGRMASNADYFAGAVWPTFYTGRDTPDHGIYHNKLWRYPHMRCEISSREWLPERPFWENLSATANRPTPRVAILDVPMTLGLPRALNGIQLSGWGTHDLIGHGSWPPALWGQLRRRFGPPRLPAEAFGPQTAASLMRLKRALLRATAQMSAVCRFILAQERWDLLLCVFGATHRAGHYLWDLSQIPAEQLDATERKQLIHALEEIYQACDRALAGIIQRLPADALLIVFAVHGMGRNNGWSDYGARIADHIRLNGASGQKAAGLLYQLRQRLPWQLTRQITRLLPKAVTDRLVELWSADMYDWTATAHFPLPMDHAGYFRINLKGREPAGIVATQSEYVSLCARLANDLGSFRDMATGKPIVREVIQRDQLASPAAPYYENLPDLVVIWSNEIAASQSPGIVSDRFGALNFERPGRLPSGRSGNHTSHGWFIARGPGLEPGSVADGYHILDLVPTVLDRLDLAADAGFQGQIIPELGG